MDYRSLTARVAPLALLASLALLPTPAAQGASSCGGPSASSMKNAFAVGSCSKSAQAPKQLPAMSEEPQDSKTGITPGNEPKVTYELRPACVPRATTGGGGPTACTTSTTCMPGTTLYGLYRIDAAGKEKFLDYQCATPQQAAANPPRRAPARPQVTPAMVLRAFRQVPVPTSTSIAQPAGRTLVNFDTIFHTTADPFTRQVTLLGQNVTLDIHATRFDWTWGDGTQSSTTVPGAPYPAKQVVHRYPHAHTTVRHHVTVTWGATYSVGDGPQQDVPGTVTRAGPPTGLRISEATPALSGQGH